jgi:hypothetical protein
LEPFYQACTVISVFLIGAYESSVHNSLEMLRFYNPTSYTILTWMS